MKFKPQHKVILFSFILFVFLIQKTHAQIPAAIPFGGPIAMTYECACSGGWFILAYDEKTKLPLPMVFQFGASMLRANYNIFVPSVQTLGSYVPGGWCQVASSGCFGGFATQGTISPFGFPGIGTGSI